jgi:hypothetical protein
VIEVLHFRAKARTFKNRLLLLCGIMPSLIMPRCIAQTPKSGMIVPGESVAGLRLGSTLSDFRAIFPKKPDIDMDYSSVAMNPCPASSQWVDLERKATGVFVILQNDRISQISVQTPRFHLENGVSIEASAARVKHLYPHGKEFVLIGSGGKSNGGRDLHYWIDSSDGVAFELYGDKGLVSAISIFEKGKEYLPDGCISPPQEWRTVRTSHTNNATESRSH